MQVKPPTIPSLTIGLDVGNRFTEICEIDEHGEVIRRDRVSTTVDCLRKRLSGLTLARVVLEVGCDSPWMSRLLSELGHEVLVANSRSIALIHGSDRKDDRTDAERLARLGRLDPSLLRPIQHRSEEGQCHLEVLRARDQLVSVRTALINHVRGATKGLGGRLPTCSAEAFGTKASRSIPESLALALQPLLAEIQAMTRAIKAYDQAIERLSTGHYPATKLLRQVRGVGPLTALCFVLTISDPSRFRRSRQVGSYLGLTPRKHASGDRDPQMRITKAGDPLLRRLLVMSAQYMLGHHGIDTDLRRFGQRVSLVGGKAAKKRAVVAVARKTAVLLHRLWTTGAVYEPLRNSTPQAA